PALVQVLVEDGAGGDDDVDEPPVDEIAEDFPESGGDEGSREPEQDRRPFGVPEGVLPDLEAPTQVPGLDRALLEGGEELAEASVLGDVDRPDRAPEARPGGPPGGPPAALVDPGAQGGPTAPRLKVGDGEAGTADGPPPNGPRLF